MGSRGVVLMPLEAYKISGQLTIALDETFMDRTMHYGTATGQDWAATSARAAKPGANTN